MSDPQFDLDEMYKNCLHLDNPLQGKNVTKLEKRDIDLAVQRIESEKFEAAIKYYEYLCKKQLERERAILLTTPDRI